MAVSAEAMDAALAKFRESDRRWKVDRVIGDAACEERLNWIEQNCAHLHDFQLIAPSEFVLTWWRLDTNVSEK